MRGRPSALAAFFVFGREQFFDIAALGTEVAPLEVAVDAAGALNVTWNDSAHSSRYHPGWLRAWDYSNPPEKSSNLPPSRVFAARPEHSVGVERVDDPPSLRRRRRPVPTQQHEASFTGVAQSNSSPTRIDF